MIVAAWNIRGLNQRAKQRGTRDWLLDNNVDVFCLVENKVREINFARIARRTFGGYDVLHNECNGG